MSSAKPASQEALPPALPRPGDKAESTKAASVRKKTFRKRLLDLASEHEGLEARNVDLVKENERLKEKVATLSEELQRLEAARAVAEADGQAAQDVAKELAYQLRQVQKAQLSETSAARPTIGGAYVNAPQEEEQAPEEQAPGEPFEDGEADKLAMEDFVEADFDGDGDADSDPLGLGIGENQGEEGEANGVQEEQQREEETHSPFGDAPAAEPGTARAPLPDQATLRDAALKDRPGSATHGQRSERPATAFSERPATAHKDKSGRRLPLKGFGKVRARPRSRSGDGHGRGSGPSRQHRNRSRSRSELVRRAPSRSPLARRETRRSSPTRQYARPRSITGSGDRGDDFYAGSGNHREDVKSFIAKNDIAAAVVEKIYHLTEPQQKFVMGTDGGKNTFTLVNRVKNPSGVVVSRIAKLGPNAGR